MTSEEALKAAMSTWPSGMRPVVHWSESQGGKIAHAHSVRLAPAPAADKPAFRGPNLLYAVSRIEGATGQLSSL